MIPTPPPNPKRRDLLVTSALAMAGTGAVLALWPFIAALGPAADTRARRVIFDLNNLKDSAQSLWDAGHAPMLIFRRTPNDLASLRNSPLQNGMRDRDSEMSQQPKWAKNWHRSLKPELMVCVAKCTREDCIVSRQLTVPELSCPCCGSRYDLAGRALTGPTPKNLKVPNYHFISESEIEFSASEIQESGFTRR